MPTTQDPKPKVIVSYRDRTAQYFTEDLGSDLGKFIPLEMVIIPPGTFMMGSPETELNRQESEGPQHEVVIENSFFMGKYPVTQAQWQAGAKLPKVKRDIESEPSSFKGDNNGDRPVERISWYDAVEFCDRLTQHTKRPYRLPSEAEWEYACRANTKTPFHFGETITTNLANYRGTDWELGVTTYSGAYGDGPHGQYREETTDVGSFKVANAFGLYDMHGNVWEWCADHWHENYDDAPTSNTIWPSSDESALRVLRGGSWVIYPGSCRSASRDGDDPDDRDNNVGLRVVCAAAGQ